MLTDVLSIPGVGGIAAAGALYTGFSLLVAGPLVGERMIERSGWTAQCERGLGASSTHHPTQSTISGECQNLLGPFFGTDGRDFCQRNGQELEGLAQLVRRFGQARRTVTPQSICACAAHEVLDNRRNEFALHAGSMRLISPRPVRNLHSELSGAAAACGRKSS